MSKMRIVIADDHLLFRAMLEEMLRKDQEMEVVYSCGSGEEVLEYCQGQAEVDLIILDIGMPGIGGIRTLQKLKEDSVATYKVVMLTTFEDDENIVRAVACGADGYLIKDMTPEVLCMSLKCIYHNVILFHRGAYKLLQTAVSVTHGGGERKLRIDHMVFDSMDIRIIQLIVQGKSNREIAAILSYSEGTVKNKISKLLSLTGLADRTEISVFAINNGMV